MKLGLVTYMWGADWDLPTLLANCRETKVLGVELRTTHKHGVEPSLTAEQRKAVRDRFTRTSVKLSGLGSTCEFHSPKPEEVKQYLVGKVREVMRQVLLRRHTVTLQITSCRC